MNPKITLLTIATAALALAGCANYTIRPIANTDDPWKKPADQKGYVFYQPELYFLVTSAPDKAAGTNAAPAGPGAGTNAAPASNPAPSLTVSPIYLPNPDKKYRVTTFNFLAKSDFTFNFNDGWQLTSIADKADNSSVATALAGQMASIMTAAGAMSAPAKPPKSFLLHPNYVAGVITGFTPVLLPLLPN